MTAVILSPRAEREIKEHAQALGIQSGGGLLIGRVVDREAVVARALRVPAANGAGLTERSTIEAGAVANVRRSLEGTGQSIVGAYRSRFGGWGPAAEEEQAPPDGAPGDVWLTATGGEEQGPELRAWWLDTRMRRAREIPIGLLTVSRPVACPE